MFGDEYLLLRRTLSEVQPDTFFIWMTLELDIYVQKMIHETSQPQAYNLRSILWMSRDKQVGDAPLLSGGSLNHGYIALYLNERRHQMPAKFFPSFRSIAR